MDHAEYDLAHRFTADSGIVFLSGIQALARDPHRAAAPRPPGGLNTAAFVSGYPGSPLGGFDGTMRNAAALVPDLPIVCRPAVNEEYAATAVMGSQLAGGAARLPLRRRRRHLVRQGPGRRPRRRRAAPRGVRRHARARRRRRVRRRRPQREELDASVVVGRACSSDLHMPMLYPGDPAEVLELGRHAVALSRASGLWTAMKIVADVADGTASVELDPDRARPGAPGRSTGSSTPRPPEGRLLTPLTLDLEREIYEVRYRLATAYAAANRLNRVTADPRDAWIGIAASGITYREVREAFRRLGLPDEASIARAGDPPAQAADATAVRSRHRPRVRARPRARSSSSRRSSPTSSCS